MNNNTKLRIRGSRKLFESIALEILAEAKGGKSHAQKLTEKMMGKKKKEKMEEAPKEEKEVKKLKEFDDFEDDFEDDMPLDNPLGMGPEMGTEEDLKSDLIKAGFSEEEAIKTAAQLVKIGKTKEGKGKLKEWEGSHYQIDGGKCYRVTDEGWEEVSMSKCR